MEQKLYKTVNSAGISSIVTGIIAVVAGLACVAGGILALIQGGRLLGARQSFLAGNCFKYTFNHPDHSSFFCRLSVISGRRKGWTYCRYTRSSSLCSGDCQCRTFHLGTLKKRAKSCRLHGRRNRQPLDCGRNYNNLYDIVNTYSFK